MKITGSSDWRDAVPFETSVRVADLVPGEPARCSGCGSASGPRAREELWAIKHRHPHDPAGYVRFYCDDHVPTFSKAAELTLSRGERATGRAPRPAPVRRWADDRAPRAMCAECFVEVNAQGVCGMCGRPAA